MTALSPEQAPNLNPSQITVRPPVGQEWPAYYHLRYAVLRAPWGEPEGSERVDDDGTAYHAVAVGPFGMMLGVGRLHMNSATEGQVRFMAVLPEAQGKGVGKLIVRHLEETAQARGAQTMVLHARQNAVPFYESLGYTVKEKSYLLFNEIQHWLMTRELV